MKTVRQKQLTFRMPGESSTKAKKSEFGGALLRNSHAKTKRPITISRPMHLVMRSSMAKGPLSLLRKRIEIHSKTRRLGKKLGVRVYKIAVAGNHIHLIILPHSRRAYTAFVRSLSGLISRRMLGLERGKAAGLQRDGAAGLQREDPKSLRFWDQRPFSRPLTWGREFKGVCAYLTQNVLEALGFIPYQPRRLNPLVALRQ